MSSESFGWSWHSGVLWRGDSVYWGLAGKSKFFGLLEGQAGVEASLTQGCRGECWSTALAPLALVGTKFNLSSMLLQWFNLDNVCRLTGLFKFQEWWMIWGTCQVFLLILLFRSSLELKGDLMSWWLKSWVWACVPVFLLPQEMFWNLNISWPIFSVFGDRRGFFLECLQMYSALGLAELGP